jgi:UDP-N-acetylmuramate--alanine ligase
MGEDPSFIVGGVINKLNTNAHAGKGKTFVIEADEYDRMFLGLKPKYAIVTSLEYDHPDCYPTPADYKAAFVDFVKLLPANGAFITCADDKGAASLAAEAKMLGKKVVQYGAVLPLGMSSEWVLAQNIKPNNTGGFSFDAAVLGQTTPVALSMPGRHNILNALSVLAVIGLMVSPSIRQPKRLHNSVAQAGVSSYLEK